MYSNKKNINYLTCLLQEFGVRDVVVCPGSRNAPIIHDLCEMGFRCVPVTDERSAGFVAMGMTLEYNSPVAVCVTSGSAVLNLLPAVVEASMRHLPLIVISADRPEERVGQLEAQTIDQKGVLGRFVKKSVNIPEPHDAISEHLCQRLVNEALNACMSDVKGPVHINVPLDDPLFGFTRRVLPDVKPIRSCDVRIPNVDIVFGKLLGASRPLVIVGQMQCLVDGYGLNIDELGRCIPVLSEPLSNVMGGNLNDKLIKTVIGKPEYSPDFILCMGGGLVNRTIKDFVASIPDVEIWSLSADGEVHDLYRRLDYVLNISAEEFFSAPCFDHYISQFRENEFTELWHKAISRSATRKLSLNEDNIIDIAVSMFEKFIDPARDIVHYANSSVVRAACRNARHYIYVNRGVNGIEGSLSTAAGHSLVADYNVFCVIGDLSFFYDSNALWNVSLCDNLRILLINNGKGKIFDNIKGFPTGELSEMYIKGLHNATAKGICESYAIEYMSASNLDEYAEKLSDFIDADFDAPVVFEFFV